MIWVTGDKHGQPEALQTPEYKQLRKNDTLIICGDFGFIWNESKEESKNLRWLAKRKYQIAFVDGCHENFDKLGAFPVEDFAGGKARRIEKNIVQLLRGEAYSIEGKSILCFGGGLNETHEDSLRNIAWWPQETPSEDDVDTAIKSIEKANGHFDLMISFEAPSSIHRCMEDYLSETGVIHDVLEEIRTHCAFSKWFFGRYHVDKSIPPIYRAVFNDVVAVE